MTPGKNAGTIAGTMAAIPTIVPGLATASTRLVTGKAFGGRPRHRKGPSKVKRAAAALASLAALAAPGLTSANAQASLTPGARLMNWAESHATGHWYEWGGIGLAYYDCSGLVYRAAGQEGISLPRTTYEMVHSWHLYRVYSPRRGDLAFWGPVGDPYHVEFVTIWHGVTYGARDPGTRVGWHNDQYWMPTAYYRIR